MIYTAILVFTVFTNKDVSLSSVAVTFEVEPELKYIVVELTTETSLVGVLPFSIDNLKCNIFIRWSSMESKNRKVMIIWARGLKQMHITK